VSDESAIKKAQIHRISSQSEICLRHGTSARDEDEAFSEGDIPKTARDGAS
jgi:hypothetical protein